MDKNQKLKAGAKAAKTLLTGMFADRSDAETAYRLLYERGYTKRDIHILMSVETLKDKFPDHPEVNGAGYSFNETSSSGFLKGGGIGALSNAIAAPDNTKLIPDLGIVVAGPIASKLAQREATGKEVKKDLVSLIASSGVPKKQARVYESGIKDGHMFVAVQPFNSEDAEYLESRWKAGNGKEINY